MKITLDVNERLDSIGILLDIAIHGGIVVSPQLLQSAINALRKLADELERVVNENLTTETE